MKKIVLTSLMMVCLPFLAVAQSVEDDLYFIPKKKAEKKEEVKQEVKVAVPQKQNNTTVYAAPGSTVVVKDVKGNMRDVDEYNRRYTSRDNTFSMENDTLYIEEKPLNERGEWVNGFEGSQDDYEYAMRIVRFRNPRYAIPVSSPLYWDVVYGLPSWDWNVYDDGLYAYVFPTYTNRLWWDWRFNYLYGPGWSFSWGWTSPWYYSSWYSPYWYGGYWGGFYGGGYWGHHHHWGGGPSWGWGGGGRPYGRTVLNANNRSRYSSSGSFNSSRGTGSRSSYQGTHTRATSGRVVGTRNGEGASYIRSSSRSTSRSQGVQSSRTEGTRGGTYTRPSSTRSYTRTSTTGSNSSSRTNTNSAPNRSRSTYSRKGSPTRSSSTYSRGSSTSPSRSYDSGSSSRSSSTYTPFRSSSSSSYTPSSSSSRSSGGSYSGGSTSSSRSSGGGSSRSSSRR